MNEIVRMETLAQRDPDEAVEVAKEAAGAMVPISIILDHHGDIMPDKKQEVVFIKVKKYVKRSRQKKKRLKKRSKKRSKTMCIKKYN